MKFSFTRQIVHSIFILGAVLSFSSANISCTSENASPKVKNKPLAMDWMVGDWIRIDEDEGKKTVEIWKKKTSIEYIGIGCTTLDVDTVFYEDMRLYRKNNSWVLEITGGDGHPMDFKVTKFTKNRFVAENPDNVFPKTIEYKMGNYGLQAIISDGITTIPFSFVREN